MRFDGHPLNLEAKNGPMDAMKAMVRIKDVGSQANLSTLRAFAARTPGVLSPDVLAALSSGDMTIDRADFSNVELRQEGQFAGLREGSDLAESQVQEDTYALEFFLFEAGWDMPVKGPGYPSSDTEYDAVLERADGPWYVAITCLDYAGQVIICSGGLDQWDGFEHLAAVRLGPSDSGPLRETADWLVGVLTGFKPVLDAALANIASDTDVDAPAKYAIRQIAYTDTKKSDEWPAVYVMPGMTRITPDGISSPDRFEMMPTFNIRVVSYGDDGALNFRLLTELSDTILRLLDTRKYRQATLPSGNEINRCYATAIDFGRTQDEWDEAVDITWSCEMVLVGMF